MANIHNHIHFAYTCLLTGSIFIISGSVGLIVLLCMLIAAIVCGCAVHRYKKKKAANKKDDEYSLLPKSPDYVEFDEEQDIAK